MSLSTITIDNNGTQFGYLDSGAPQGVPEYTTIFAIHGMGFSGLIFKKIIALAPASGIRFVAVNRRDYPGSTPLSQDEWTTSTQGTEEQKDAFLKARGVELATFIDNFIVQHSLPPISQNGQSGGIVILGWSVGNAFSLATVSNLDSLEEDARTRVASRLRTLIINEPAWLVLGLPTPEKNWAPLIDTSIPEETRIPLFSQWVTSYFKHQEGFLGTRSLDSLEWVLPSYSRVPTIFNMSASDIALIIDSVHAGTDIASIFNLAPQLLASYQKAVFGAPVRSLAPSMKVWHLYGDASPAFAPGAWWSVEEENKARGGGYVQGKLIPGANHFMYWDDPEATLQALLDILNDHSKPTTQS